jgi:hypothetical protein
VPPYPGRVVCRSDWRGVSCTHTDECPLFPLLNVSLHSWRDYYCDSEERWRDCARYKLALTGKPVPISLLPNGKDAWHLRPSAEADRSGMAKLARAPLSERDTGSPQIASWFKPTQASWAPLSRRDSGSSEAASWFESAQTQPLELSRPSPVPQPPGSPPAGWTPDAPQAHHLRRRWWTRLADWMRAPA